MRKGLLSLAGLVTVAVGAASAQPAPNPPPPASNGAPWGNTWERIVISASTPAPGEKPPEPPPPPPAEPETPANRAWFGADYLVWWTKNGPLPAPLLTSGPASAAVIGGLSQQGTQVLFGGAAQDYDTANGLRIEAGIWLDADRQWGVEAAGFFLEQLSTGIGASSNTIGSPVLAQPLINPATGGEFTELIALPGLLAGSAVITTHSRFQGWELNGLANVLRNERWSVDVLAGFRTVKLQEDLLSSSDFSPLINQFLTFDGRAVSTGSTVTTLDSFEAKSQFYGLQLGGRAEWTSGDLTVSAVGKLALGGSQELVRVAGESSLTAPGAATVTVPGGVLAVSGNIGRYFRDEFAVLPELGLQVGYRLSRHVEVRMGYSLLYLSSVARPGNQVSRAIEPALIPTDPAFGTATATQPALQIRSSEFWAQGVNFGVMLHF